MNEMPIFFKTYSWNSTHLFQWVFHWLKRLFWYGVNLQGVPPSSQILVLRWIFSLENKKNLHGTWFSEYEGCCSYMILCFTKNISSKSIETDFFRFCYLFFQIDTDLSRLLKTSRHHHFDYISCSDVYSSSFKF